MILNAVRRADNEYRVVEKRKRALRFGRKINVPGSVKENIVAVFTEKRACFEKIVIPRSRSIALVSRNVFP